jgi:hypothetical protein
MTSLKRFNHPLTAVAALLAVAAGCASCGSNGCEETRESYCTAQLKSTTQTTLSSVSVWALSDRFTDGDSIMISGESSPTELSLILDPDTTETRLRIQFNGRADNEALQLEDTLTLRYEPYAYFIDMECGCSVRFELKEVTSTYNFIQDVFLKQTTITNDPAVNLLLEY